MKLILKTYSQFAFCIFLFCNISEVLAQEKQVRLVEDIQKKRTIIYVQNDTDSDKSVFLKINPIGYRRSAQRPIIKNIPANSKVQMIILIPFTDVKSSYTYNLIVNEELQNIDAKRQKQNSKETSISNTSKYDLLIYTEQNCTTCDTLIQKLKDKKVDFLEIDIDSKNNLLTPQFWDAMYFKGYNRKRMRIPFAKKNGRLYHPINDFDKFISTITSKKKKGKSSIF